MAATSTTVAGRMGTWRWLTLGIVVAWLPLCIASALGGALRGQAEQGPFALDLATHARLLIALPLLVVGQRAMARALGGCLVAQIVELGLAGRDDPRFIAAADAFWRGRRRGLVDGILVVLALVGSTWAIHDRPREVSSWPLTTSGGYSLAGWWLALVALPLFQYALARALWTGMLWTRLLMRLSRLPLRLVPTHPDSIGGLAFLGEAQSSFRYIVLAVSSVLAAADARAMLFEGLSLRALQTQALVLASLVVVCVFGPMLLFTGALRRLRRAGKAQLGALGARYGRLFQRRWLEDPAEDDGALLGSSDIQSLADLANAYQVVKRIGLFPIQRFALIDIAVALALPAVPLVFIELPLATLLQRLLTTIL